MSIPIINFPHLTVSDIQPGQDSKGHHDIAYLHPHPMSLASINIVQSGVIMSGDIANSPVME